MGEVVYKTESFRIEVVNYEELPNVVRINETVLPENYPFYFYELLYRNYRKAFLVAKVDDRIVGYVMCRVEHALTMELLPKFYKIGHVVSIGVLPRYRRMGIGTTLMVKALDALKNEYGCREVYLEVRVSNIPAINLYKKLGFYIDRVVKGYYRDGEDAYIMKRSLRDW